MTPITLKKAFLAVFMIMGLAFVHQDVNAVTYGSNLGASDAYILNQRQLDIKQGNVNYGPSALNSGDYSQVPMSNYNVGGGDFAPTVPANSSFNNYNPNVGSASSAIVVAPDGTAFTNCTYGGGYCPTYHDPVASLGNSAPMVPANPSFNNYNSYSSAIVTAPDGTIFTNCTYGGGYCPTYQDPVASLGNYNPVNSGGYPGQYPGVIPANTGNYQNCTYPSTYGCRPATMGVNGVQSRVSMVCGCVPNCGNQYVVAVPSGGYLPDGSMQGTFYCGR